MGMRSAGYLDFRQQVIFEYLVSNHEDQAIAEGTDNIIEGCQQKGIESYRVELKMGAANKNANRAKIAAASNWIDGPFRLYLRGHGDWRMMTLGDRRASEVAADFGVLGKYDLCQVISITGCELALSKKAQGMGLSTQSFAKQFHRLISGEGQMEMVKRIPVFARTMEVKVTNFDMAIMSLELAKFHQHADYKLQGSKSNKDSKKVFYWEGRRQMMADATTSNVSSVLLGLAEFDTFGAEA